LPWLYYRNTVKEIIHKSNRVKAKMSLSSSNDDETRYNHIPFKLAKYAFDGAFLGWEDLTTQLFLCPITEDESKRFRRVGLSLVKECKFDLERLVDRTVELPNLNYFFELFLVDYNDDLIDVPVLIRNFINSADATPNTGDSIQDQWRFVRRFFLYENISAIEGTGEFLKPTKSPTYVRFVHEMRLVFELDRNGDETIYVPYLQLFYRSIESSLVTDSYPTDIVIVTNWFMSGKDALNTELGFFIAVHVLIIAWVIWKVYKWISLHPQNYESATFVLYLGSQIIYSIIESWSSLIFWFLFLVSFIWGIIFKFEDAFYLLFPNRYNWKENYLYWEAIFG